jgi:hypothetical protein
MAPHGMLSQDIIWLCTFLNQIEYLLTNPTFIYCDNQSCIQQIYNHEVEMRPKHVDTLFHATKDQQEKTNLQTL